MIIFISYGSVKNVSCTVLIYDSNHLSKLFCNDVLFASFYACALVGYAI